MISGYVRLSVYAKGDLHIYKGLDISVKHCNYLLQDALQVPSLCSSIAKYVHKQSTLLLEEMLSAGRLVCTCTVSPAFPSQENLDGFNQFHSHQQADNKTRDQFPACSDGIIQPEFNNLVCWRSQPGGILAPLLSAALGKNCAISGDLLSGKLMGNDSGWKHE